MTKLSISQRGVGMPASAMRKLEPFADEAKARGVRVIHLNIGQPDIETPPEFWEAVGSFSERTLAYGPSAGRTECLDGMLDYYARFDIPLTAEQIVITTAGSESLLFALMTCGDAGDEVIIPEPFYSNYAGLATMADLRVVPLITYAKDDYRLPPREVIEELIGERTRAILYSSPGNPTGEEPLSRKPLPEAAQVHYYGNDNSLWTGLAILATPAEVSVHSRANALHLL